MLRHLDVIFFILLAGVSAFLTDVAYGQTSDIRGTVVYPRNQPASPVQLASLNYNSSVAIFDSVHVWPDSECGLCHLAEDPNTNPMFFVESDQSILCVSCHPRNITVPSGNELRMKKHGYSNHPIKFSTLDFNPDKINHNIIKKNGTFYLSWSTGELPIFGDTEDSAVAECSTCHDPHGRTNIPLLGRFDNTEGDLCIVCHINIRVKMTRKDY